MNEEGFHFYFYQFVWSFSLFDYFCYPSFFSFRSYYSSIGMWPCKKYIAPKIAIFGLPCHILSYFVLITSPPCHSPKSDKLWSRKSIKNDLCHAMILSSFTFIFIKNRCSKTKFSTQKLFSELLKLCVIFPILRSKNIRIFSQNIYPR